GRVPGRAPGTPRRRPAGVRPDHQGAAERRRGRRPRGGRHPPRRAARAPLGGGPPRLRPALGQPPARIRPDSAPPAPPPRPPPRPCPAPLRNIAPSPDPRTRGI